MFVPKRELPVSIADTAPRSSDRRATLLLALVACFYLAQPALASTLRIDTSSWAGLEAYFFDNWQHHSGQFGVTATGSDPIYPVYFARPHYNDNPGIEFVTNLVQTIDFGMATNKSSVWDTSLLGPVDTIRFTLQARLDLTPASDVRLGALVWNSTTGQFFRALGNGLTRNWEQIDWLLTPAADFCLVQSGGGCTAVTGFGEGVLQFGYAVRADSTNQQYSRFGVEFDDNNSFLILATGAAVPEPSTWALACAGLVAVGLTRRRYWQ